MRKSSLPESMIALRQHGPGKVPVIERLPVPHPGRGELLVKMAAAPINPSDLSILRGDYLSRSYPFTPGLEGSGVVIHSGGGLLGRLREGRRVACSPDPGGDGTWAEYMITSALRVFPLPGDISTEQGSMMLVNPLTALAMLRLAAEGNHRAMVNNAAASALGKMLIRLAALEHMPVINVVRREEHMKELRDAGARYVLNSGDPGFEQQLRELTGELGATLILDAVGGTHAAQLLRAAPCGSTLVEYARLSGGDLVIDPSELITGNKHVTGFLLANWLDSRGLIFKIRLMNRLKRLMSTTLASDIRRQMPLGHVEEAIRLYRENMSAGKIILVP